MLLRREEPSAGDWRAVPIADLLDMLLPERSEGQRVVIAIDGRSSSGKTTLAQRMASVTQHAAVVHTDDLAWWHSRFDWVELLLDGIIEPFLAGREVMFRPPAWTERGREGAINVHPERSVLIIEGVGSSRRESAGWIDASVWVQADEAIIAKRNVARIASGETTSAGLAGWMSEELPFLAADRPWQRATKIVAGTPELSYEEVEEVLVASPFPQAK
jgi:hypothetical protein